jgi:peptide/nickel transport system permease protein
MSTAALASAFATREFVLAAEAMGATKFRIIFVELMPNVALPPISISLLAVSTMIVIEGALSFLGLSIPPPAPTWGNMIAQGLSDLTTMPWVWGFPAAVLFLTVLALNFVGDIVRQRIDDRDSTL